MADLDVCYEAKQRFLEKVRQAYEEESTKLDSDDFHVFTMMSQDDLSLYSPWMNMNITK